jgi:regulatory protein SWI6
LIKLTSSALKTLIQDTESSFRSELQAKQSLIDEAQKRLREQTTTLANERRNLASLEAKANERAILKHQIANLRRLNNEKRAFLSTTGPLPTEDVTLGDADTGLSIDIAKLRQLSPDDSLSSNTRTPEQEAYLKSLPPSHVLEARVRAYAAHNDTLDTRKQDLKTKSAILEKKLRRLVALSAGVAEDTLDTTADRLAAAIQSEEGEEMDMSRLREFLRRLEEGGE